MKHFVVWLKSTDQSQNAGADFAQQRQTLNAAFQKNVNVTIVTEADIGVHCDAPDDVTIDNFESDLPTQWQIDRTQYQSEPF